jgi:D-alanyl-D-alanine dipeptidase
MIKIKDNNEPLVDIKKMCPDLIINLDQERMFKEKTAYLRKTVAEMICTAKKELQKGITFIINDAWRPQYVQEEIYQGFMKRSSKKYPQLSQNEIGKLVDQYVAPAKGKFASGHMTGGAVDLRLWKNGRKIPMIDLGLTYQENAQSSQTKLPTYLQKNREVMFNALKKAGLSNYPKEYWHWSYGDIQWAQRNKKKIAIYGVMENINLPSKL